MRRHCEKTLTLRQVSIHASVKDATLVLPTTVHAWSGFNPRICKRCDGYSEVSFGINKVSIHASVKDATLPKVGYITTGGFQSTHL